MKTKHTPGPWKAVNGDNDLSGYFIRILSISDAEIAPARAYGDNKEQRQANARLIAAAPELLAALQLVENCNNYTSDGCPVSYELQAALTEVRAAIRKATGEA